MGRPLVRVKAEWTATMLIAERVNTLLLHCCTIVYQLRKAANFTHNKSKNCYVTTSVNQNECASS